MGRYLLRYGGSGCDIGAVTDRHRCDQCHVAADKGMVSYHGAVLGFPVVICGDNTACNVGVHSDGSVADIGQVRDFGSFADFGIFQFHKIAHLDPVVQHASRTNICERPYIAIVAAFAVGYYRLYYRIVLSDTAVFYDRVRSDDGAFSDNRIAFDHATGIYHGLFPDFHTVIDIGTVGIDEYVRIQEERQGNRFGGKEIVIRDVENLWIEGLGNERVNVVTADQEANVLTFENASYVFIDNLCLGHLPKKGGCYGGVAVFINSAKIRIENTELFGCGINGLELCNTEDVLFTRSVITDCSSGILFLSNSSRVCFEYSSFKENRGTAFVNINNCSDVIFRGCSFENNTAVTDIAALFAEYFKQRKIDAGKFVAVSPDVGSIERVRRFAQILNIPLAIIDKRRPEANRSEILHVVGQVEGKNVIMIDDIADTAGTLANTAAVMKEKGALSIYACCTHAVLSGPAIERIENSCIDEMIILNTICTDRVQKILSLPKFLPFHILNVSCT